MQAFGADFDVLPGHVNTPAIGVPPAHVVRAVRESVDRWAVGEVTAPGFDPAVATARGAFATLVGVPETSVAIGDTVSALVGRIAASLPPRSRVLSATREFTSLTFPFAARGHEVVEADLGTLPELAARHDVVVVSVIASADGAPVDLEALAAQRGDALIVLDATQSLGWLPEDLSWADAVVAAGYKWLLSPRGAAWMACSERLLERVVPTGAGWYAGEDRWSSLYGLPLRLATDARRLDSSAVWIAHVGAAAALPWLASLDRAAVHAHDVGLADRVRTGLGMPPERSAIVTVTGPDAHERLTGAGLRASARAGGARVGFHLHNTVDDAEAVLAALR